MMFSPMIIAIMILAMITMLDATGVVIDFTTRTAIQLPLLGLLLKATSNERKMYAHFVSQRLY